MTHFLPAQLAILGRRFTPMHLALCAVLGLMACTPDPKLVEAGLIEAPQPTLIDGVYGQKDDGAFVMPAVPVEKVPTEFLRQTVYFPSDEAVGTIIINPATKHLHLVTGKNQAIRYGIAVGKAGFEWAGEALVTGRKDWPTWTPPPEMITRKPELIEWKDGQPGGLQNPLGARALYLTTNGVDYGYRIHGTPEWFSIGKNASSGCIRMINQDVVDLHSRVQDGAKVVVLNADGSYPKGLKLPPPPPKPQPAVVQAAAVSGPAGDDAMVLSPALLRDAGIGSARTSGGAASPAATAPTQPALAQPTASQPTASQLVTPTPLPTTAAPVICRVPLVDGLCPLPAIGAMLPKP